MSGTDAVKRARQFVEGGTAPVARVLEWRQELWNAGARVLARALSRKLAEDFIKGEHRTADEVDAIWKSCRADEAFSHARRVLRRRRSRETTITLPPADPKTAPDDDELREQLALMTSKDPDLAASVRHDWALRILEADLETSSAETLGIAGGIYKRRWDWDGRSVSLQQSLLHYLAPVDRGWREGIPYTDHDRDGRGVTARDGYPAINAAFVCDLLANQTSDPTTAQAYRTRADGLRTRITNAVRATDYWSRVTLAEAKFGLGDVSGAKTLLRQAALQKPDPWQRRTTAEQIARLGDLRGVEPEKTAAAVAALIGEGTAGPAYVESVLVGKVGLALSGGGFRASLYHLGVLARLAESDLLRHVSTISTVSGGSMVGAAYYLRLRHLLQTTAAPKRSEYVGLVKALIEDFLHATDANLRTSLLTDFKTAKAILFGEDDVFAARMADAIWRTIYSRTAQGDPILAKDPQMAEIGIVPKDADADFHPRYHNIFRRAKVPALMINATSLNTGHSWHFTTQSMGESPFSIVPGADALPRLRRSYYRNSRGDVVRPVTLSQAVAASACVPGLFAPLRFGELYDGYDVGLVDGGVFDNQGALALLQDDCNVLVVSDAAGQLGVSPAPGGGHVSPLLRAMEIFQERMRLASFDRLREAQDNRQLTGLAYVHMKQDLQAGAVDWKNSEDPSRDDDQLPGGPSRDPLTGYGVLKTHQASLAAIRTDLDAFSEIEAAALMASGYLAMDQAVARLVLDVPALADKRSDEEKGEAEQEPWFFEPCIRALKVEHPVLDLHLKTGAGQFLRLAALDEAVRNKLLIALGLLAVGLIVLLVVIWPKNFTVSGQWIVVTIVGLVLSWLGKKYLGRFSWITQLTDPLGALQSYGRRWLGVVGTWALARMIVPGLTKKYLAAGTLDKLG